MTLLQLYGKSTFLDAHSPLQSQIATFLAGFSTSPHNFTFYSNGKIITNFDSLSEGSTITALVRLMGGKGGYGAKLKTEGGKKVKPNDNMFSRNHNGERIVYATMEKDYRDFVMKKVEEDQKVAKEREQFKVMESTLNEGKSFMKLNRNYQQNITDTEKRLVSSLEAAKKRMVHKDEQPQEHPKRDTPTSENPNEEGSQGRKRVK